MITYYYYLGYFYEHGLTLIPAWIGNHTTYVDLISSNINLRTISQELPQQSITKICLKITYQVSKITFKPPSDHWLNTYCADKSLDVPVHNVSVSVKVPVSLVQRSRQSGPHNQYSYLVVSIARPPHEPQPPYPVPQGWLATPSTPLSCGMAGCW